MDKILVRMWRNDILTYSKTFYSFKESFDAFNMLRESFGDDENVKISRLVQSNSIK